MFLASWNILECCSATLFFTSPFDVVCSNHEYVLFSTPQHHCTVYKWFRARFSMVSVRNLVRRGAKMSLLASKPHTTNCPWEALKYLSGYWKGNGCYVAMETATGITCVWKPCQVLQVVAKRAKYLSVCQKGKGYVLCCHGNSSQCVWKPCLVKYFEWLLRGQRVCCHGNSRNSIWDWPWGVGDAIEAQRTTSGCTYRIARSEL